MELEPLVSKLSTREPAWNRCVADGTVRRPLKLHRVLAVCKSLSLDAPPAMLLFSNDDGLSF